MPELKLDDDLMLTKVFAWERDPANTNANPYTNGPHSLWLPGNVTRRISFATDDIIIGIDMRIKNASVHKVHDAHTCPEESQDGTCYLIMADDVHLSNFIDLGNGLMKTTFPIGTRGHRMEIVLEKF